MTDSPDRLFELLEDKAVFVTGATGLIGRTLVRSILDYNSRTDRPVRIAALVRDRQKAERLFPGIPEDQLRFHIGDVASWQGTDECVDYIIHGASMTSSRGFVERPVETIRTAVEGTLNMLELARRHTCRGFVYLSSMEIYGTPETDEKISETHGTDLDPMQVRASYPTGKRLCESLCASYASEYGVPAKVIRLTQTFGPGVEYDDGRVFAEFARCAIEGRDIVLHTKGETRRSYLYTEDAVRAILTVLLRGETGLAYNAANEETYCSVLEMARLVAEGPGEGKIGVRVEDSGNAASYGYAPVLRMNLDTGRLRALGWQPSVGLEDMFRLLTEDMRQRR